MTDLTRHRLALVLALFGTCTVMAHTWNQLVAPQFRRIPLPVFQRSSPDVREWPRHTYLPIG